MRCSTSARMQFAPLPLVLVLVPCRVRRVRRQPERHLYFARQVSFLSCADSRESDNLLYGKITPLQSDRDGEVQPKLGPHLVGVLAE